MAIHLLDKLHASGDLRTLAETGLISLSVLNYRKIYHAYMAQIEKGVKSQQAVTDVSDVFSVSERTVYKVIEKLKP